MGEPGRPIPLFSKDQEFVSSAPECCVESRPNHILFCVLMILGVMLGHACRSVVHEETLEHKAALMSLLRTTIPPCEEFTAHCACFHSALTVSRRLQSFTKISEKIDVFRPLRMEETPLIR